MHKAIWAKLYEQALELSNRAKLIIKAYTKAYIKAMLLKLIEHSLMKYTPLFIIHYHS